MDKAALVATDFTVGAEILEALDRFGLSISVALWLHSPEYEDWRLVLSSRELDAAALAEAYGLVHDTLSAAGISLERTPALLILKMSDPFIRSLRRIFGKSKNVEGIRLGGQLVGDRFIEDAIVYRIR
jgi:hypothetical protein